MSSYTTVTEMLARAAERDAGITFADGVDQLRRIRYQDLERRALGLLGFLQAQGLGPGDELVVFVNSNEQFLDAFWAALYGGVVPVPLAVGVSDEHRLKLFRVFERLARPRLYTDARTLERLTGFAAAEGLQPLLARMRRDAILVDDIADITQGGTVAAVTPDDRAFIQFSSGSTAEPKGVVLTHRNLATNVAGIIAGTDIRPGDATLSWMPLTHDMGLIGFHLAPMAAGIDQTLVPTERFIRRPGLWLELASRQRATHLCSPNFGYKHYLKATERRRPEGLDLSRVRVIFNGAEPISVHLCEAFLDAMADSGLAHNSMFPVYGLAEASLAVAFPPPGRELVTRNVARGDLGVGAEARFESGVGDFTPLVSVGGPVQGCRVRIADDAGSELPEGRVGHIQISGDNVTRGYYGNDAANRQAFTEDGWLDTGDLGFVSEGELYITGRAKEVIFVHGQNLYPQDIEEIVHGIEGYELGKVAACGVRAPDGETDDLVVFMLHRGSAEAFLPVAEQAAERINRYGGVEVAQVLPVARIPKTTSGKIQRHLLAEAYLAGEFDAMAAELAALHRSAHPQHQAGHSGIERTLQRICKEVIPDREIGVDESLFEIGTSSLMLVQIHERIEEAFPGQVEITDLFDYPTIEALAGYLENSNK